MTEWLCFEGWKLRQRKYSLNFFKFLFYFPVSSRFWKIDCELLTPQQCKEKCSLINIDDIVGGLWIPEDGVGDPYEICLTVVNEARKMGKLSWLLSSHENQLILF